METLGHLAMTTQINSREDSIAIALALEIDLEDMISGTEAESALPTTQAINSTLRFAKRTPIWRKTPSMEQ